MGEAVPRGKKNAAPATNGGATAAYERQLLQMAAALRGIMDAAEHKHIVLGLIFLKHISDAFEEKHAALEGERSQGADPEDPDEYRAESTGFAVLRLRKTEYTELVYLAAIAPENIESLAHLADEAAYPAVLTEVVAATPAVKARPAVVAAFSRAAASLLAKVAANERESRPLAALRDALLPKLIFGEVRVLHAENALARADA